MSLDAVFISRFLAADPALDADAQALRAALERDLGNRFLVVPMETIPAWPTYNADIYLQSCPPAQYAECSYVVGARGKATWVIAAKVSAGREYGTKNVDIDIVDVGASRSVISFAAEVRPGAEDQFALGVANVLDRIIQGEAELVDIRGERVDDKEAWEAKRAAAKEAAEELSAGEDIDLMVRGMDFSNEMNAELSLSDLEQYEGRDDDTPWERYAMTKAEYVRFRNSGLTVFDWRARAAGRKRTIMIRPGLGFGSGPYKQRFDGRVALDNQTLQPFEVQVFDEIGNGTSVSAMLELGVGINEAIEIGARVQSRTGEHSYYFHNEKVGDPEPLGVVQGNPRGTVQYGGYILYSPLPSYAIRPFGLLAVTSWTGTGIDQVVQGMPAAIAELGPYEAPKMVLMEISPGVEARMSDNLDFWIRASGIVRVAGSKSREYHAGEPGLNTRYVSELTGGTFGGEVSAGVTVRLQPFGAPATSGPRSDEDEWEP